MGKVSVDIQDAAVSAHEHDGLIRIDFLLKFHNVGDSLNMQDQSVKFLADKVAGC